MTASVTDDPHVLAQALHELAAHVAGTPLERYADTCRRAADALGAGQLRNGRAVSARRQRVIRLPDDPQLREAVVLVLREGRCTTSFVQRRLGIPWADAGDLITRMEQLGIVSVAGVGGVRAVVDAAPVRALAATVCSVAADEPAEGEPDEAARVRRKYPRAYAYPWGDGWTIYATRPGDPDHCGLALADAATLQAAWLAAAQRCGAAGAQS